MKMRSGDAFFRPETTTARTSAGSVSTWAYSSLLGANTAIVALLLCYHDSSLEMYSPDQPSSQPLQQPEQPEEWYTGYDLLRAAHRVWAAAEAVPIASPSHHSRVWLDGMSR